MTWFEYVTKHRGVDNDTEVAAKSGVSTPTVGRWRRSVPQPEAVVKFARSYGRPVLEGFVAAGYLTQADVAGNVTIADLSSIPDDELVSEVLARMKRGEERVEAPPIATTKGRRGPRRQVDVVSPLGEVDVEVKPWEREGIAARRVDPSRRMADDQESAEEPS